MNRAKYFILALNLFSFLNINYSQITILNFQAPSSVSESDGYIEINAVCGYILANACLLIL